MYDLIAGHPPFHQEEIDSVLYRIGRGQTVDLSELNCNTRLKVNHLITLYFTKKN